MSNVDEGRGPLVSAARPGAGPASRRWGVVLVAAVLVQLVVLYAPSGPGGVAFPHSDKVVHVGVFLLPVAAALAAGLGRWLVVGVFAAHAVVSEVVQASALPTRSGDGWDVVADLVGVALGLGLWWVVVRPRTAPPTLSGHSGGRW